MNTETSKTTERDELLAQLEAVNADIAAIEAEIEQLSYKWTPMAPVPPDNPRLSHLLRAVGDARAKAEVLQEHINRLDKIEAYQSLVAKAVETAKATHQAITDIERSIAATGTKATIVRQRINEMQNQAQKAEDEAKAAEMEAIRAYASAVSGGDIKAEKAAHGKAQEAQAAVTAVQAQNAKNSSIIAVLDAEATALEAQAGALKIERDELRKQLFLLIRAHLNARWDAAAGDLMAIGVKLAAANAFAGVGTYEFTRLRLPVFSEGGAAYLDAETIHEQVATISDSQLLQEMGVMQ